MALNPRSLKPKELARLLNSTPLGEVATERKVLSRITKAGFGVSSVDREKNRVDIFRYLAWMFGERQRRIAESKKAVCEEWLTIAQAAASVYPPVTADAIRKWCATGLPFERAGGGGREIRIRLADLASFVQRTRPRYTILAKSSASAVEPASAPAQDADPRRAFESALRLGDARARREELRRRSDEIRLRKQLGELVSAAEVERVWSAQIGAFAQGLARLPDACVPGLAMAAAAALEGLGVPQNAAEPAVERLKAAFRAEVQQAADIMRRALSEGPANQEQGDEQEED